MKIIIEKRNYSLAEMLYGRIINQNFKEYHSLIRRIDREFDDHSNHVIGPVYFDLHGVS